MNFFKRLNVQLTAFIAIVVIAEITYFSFHVSQKQSELIKKQLSRQALVLIDNLTATVASYVVIKDYTSLESVLIRASKFESVRSMQVLDVKGKTLSDVVKNKNSEIIPRFNKFKYEVPEIVKLSTVYREDEYILIQPIVLGDVVGWVRVTYGLDSIKKLQQEIWEENISDGLILTVLTISLLLVILKRPMVFIQRYTHFSDQLDECSGDQVVVDKYSLELSHLGLALNRASKNLHEQRNSLNLLLLDMERVAAISEYSPDMILSVDVENTIQYLNTTTRIICNKLFGSDNIKIAEKLLPKNYFDIVFKCLEQNTILEDIESIVVGRTLLWKFTPHIAQQIVHCHAIDITDKKKVEVSLRDSEVRYRTLFESANDAIFIIREDKIFDCNQSAADLLGIDVKALINTSPQNYFPKSILGISKDGNNLNACRLDSGVTESLFFECECRRADTTKLHVEVNLDATCQGGNNYVLAVVRDITERKIAEKELIRQANFDSLTSLPNRELAFDRLIQSIEHAKRQNNHVGVLFVDIDRFKVVNDSLGHSAGDQLLIEIAERVKSIVREADTVARFGGDEFLFILSGINDVVDCKLIAEKILQTIADKYVINGKEFYISASVGVAAFPNDGTDANTLVRNADVAMYKAKENGRNVFQFYTSEFNIQAQKRVEMEAELRHAMEKNELSLNYQPQLDIQNNRLLGCEALLRWTNDKLGFVSPDRFIPLAEDTGLIVTIGEWVLQTACFQAAEWNKTNSLNLRVAVNVSPRQFMGESFTSTVKRVLQQSGLSADHLELEITESLLIEDADEVLDIIRELKSIGVSLALDDFGTGYSSLSYLKRYPFDILKIDRAFVNGVKDSADETEDAALCRAIAAIASSLRLEVVGEGVETQQQLNFLKDIGVEIIQGYFYSKPLDDKQFKEFLKRNISGCYN